MIYRSTWTRSRKGPVLATFGFSCHVQRQFVAESFTFICFIVGTILGCGLLWLGPICPLFHWCLCHLCSRLEFHYGWRFCGLGSLKFLFFFCLAQSVLFCFSGGVGLPMSCGKWLYAAKASWTIVQLLTMCLLKMGKISFLLGIRILRRTQGAPTWPHIPKTLYSFGWCLGGTTQSLVSLIACRTKRWQNNKSVQVLFSSASSFICSRNTDAWHSVTGKSGEEESGAGYYTFAL